MADHRDTVRVIKDERPYFEEINNRWIDLTVEIVPEEIGKVKCGHGSGIFRNCDRSV